MSRRVGLREVLASSRATLIGTTLFYFLANMGVQAKWLPMAVLVAGNISLVSGQNDSAAGPPWIQSEYMSSPPVYPSRKSYVFRISYITIILRCAV
jgi:hypothetical protein